MHMLILIVGPSGAGKDTLLDAVRAETATNSSIVFARREITRPATPGGEHHLPIDAETFARRRDAGAYALCWEAHGLCYGISTEIETALDDGLTVVASVSRTVIETAARRYRLRVVEITAPARILQERLQGRGRESERDIANRLARTMPIANDVDIISVVNDGTIAEGCAKLLAAISP